MASAGEYQKPGGGLTVPVHRISVTGRESWDTQHGARWGEWASPVVLSATSCGPTYISQNDSKPCRDCPIKADEFRIALLVSLCQYSFPQSISCFLAHFGHHAANGLLRDTAARGQASEALAFDTTFGERIPPLLQEFGTLGYYLVEE